MDRFCPKRSLELDPRVGSSRVVSYNESPKKVLRKQTD